jgi:ABC-2 type transport system permease protein/ribosome-dependent ATPase
MNLHRVSVVAGKECREIARDRVFLALAFALPVMWILVFGYTMTFDVQNIPFAVLDFDHSVRSRDLAYRFISSRYFDFRGYLTSEHQADRLLAAAKVRLVITIPEHFERDIATGRNTQIATTIDGTFPNRAQTIQAYAEAISQDYNVAVRAQRIAGELGVPYERALTLMQPVRLEIRYLYNQALRSIWSIAPSLVMLTLMFVPSLLTALVIVREKENGSIYNIYCSTVTRGEFLLGKMIPSVTISFIDALVLTAIAAYYFGAPFKAGLGFYLVGTLLYVLCTASIGLLVSTVVRSQNAALMIASIIGIVPAVQFSGMINPVPSLEGGAWVQAHLFPAMYFENIVLGSYLKGVSGPNLWTNACVLGGYAAALIALSYYVFRKRQTR